MLKSHYNKTTVLVLNGLPHPNILVGMSNLKESNFAKGF